MLPSPPLTTVIFLTSSINAPFSHWPPWCSPNTSGMCLPQQRWPWWSPSSPPFLVPMAIPFFPSFRSVSNIPFSLRQFLTSRLLPLFGVSFFPKQYKLTEAELMLFFKKKKIYFINYLLAIYFSTLSPPQAWYLRHGQHTVDICWVSQMCQRALYTVKESVN